MVCNMVSNVRSEESGIAIAQSNTMAGPLLWTFRTLHLSISNVMLHCTVIYVVRSFTLDGSLCNKYNAPLWIWKKTCRMVTFSHVAGGSMETKGCSPVWQEVLWSPQDVLQCGRESYGAHRMSSDVAISFYGPHIIMLEGVLWTGCPVMW